METVCMVDLVSLKLIFNILFVSQKMGQSSYRYDLLPTDRGEPLVSKEVSRAHEKTGIDSQLGSQEYQLVQHGTNLGDG